MISVVILFGVLKENLKRGFRILSLDFYDALQDKNFISTIPITYWTREENNRINRMKEGTQIIIKGHIESDDEYGLYIVCESIHFTK